MSEFQKPIRQTVNIKDAFMELVGKDLLKDLHENEEVCPVCKGVGMKIDNNPYGLSDDPNPYPRFPYLHQSLTFCHNCYNGIVRRCQYCGKQLPRGRLVCDCETVQEQKRKEKDEKLRLALESAEKYPSDSLGAKFECAYSEHYYNYDGYFFTWEDFFESWFDHHEENDPRPSYVWATDKIEMSLDASSIVSMACDDLYEDAYDDIGDQPIRELQDYLDGWAKRHGRSAYMFTRKYAIEIPWGDA